MSEKNHSSNDTKMMQYPKIVGWSVVIGLWSITGCALECMKNKENSRLISDTAEVSFDLCAWIVEDVANGYVDSTYADTYIDNLEGIIIDLGVTR